MTTKISIIIPVYNTERYLYRCLDSAVSQTLKDIEIIIIDDASTDASLEIIRCYAKKDKRIQVIAFPKNKGNGIGRNTALKKAKGVYVLFLDSDDWLEKNTAEFLYQKALVKHHEIVLFGYLQHFEESNKINAMLPSYNEEDANYYCSFLMHTKGFCSMPWAYLYSRKLLMSNHVTFTEGIYFEDINFVAQALFSASKIGVVNKYPLYHYLVRKQSITGFLTKKKIEDLFTAHILLKEFLIEKGVFKSYERAYLIRFLVNCIECSFLGYFKMSKKGRDKELDEFMEEIRKSDVMHIDSIAILREVAEEHINEATTYDHFKSASQFLGTVRRHYKVYRFVYKVRFGIYTFFENLRIFSYQKCLTNKN